jgi:hypothetical protein
MLDAGRLLPPLGPVRTEVAESRGIGHEVHVHFIGGRRNDLVNFNADHALGIVMLLLAGYLAGMAAGAPVVLYQ